MANLIQRECLVQTLSTYLKPNHNMTATALCVDKILSCSHSTAIQTRKIKSVSGSIRYLLKTCPL